MIKQIAFCTTLFLVTGTMSYGQTNVNLGGMTVDTSAAIEVTADSLSVDQDSNRAVFDGNVIIGQGDLRITAGRVEVVYGAATSDIAQLLVTGGMTFVTAEEAAEAQTATYDIETGMLTLSGEVLLTQGQSAIAAERMLINVTDGTAQMDG